ncbi:hypothetical protein DL93DRAFT_762963 [Clavulina sp. PMI_390]|nr:hypothetical protein DL93DRAFT_762963 [Clavulina sp. PMI_390]
MFLAIFPIVFIVAFFFMITGHITKGPKYAWPLWVGAAMFFSAVPLALLVVRICSPYHRRYTEHMVDRRHRREELLASNKVMHVMPVPMKAADPAMPTKEVQDVEMDPSNIPVVSITEDAQPPPQEGPARVEEERPEIVLEKDQGDAEASSHSRHGGDRA